MVQTVSGKVLGQLADILLLRGARKATKFLSPHLTVVAVRRFKPTVRNRREELLFTIGVPNYASTQIIKAYLKAKEPFPVKRIKIQWYPTKGK